MRDDVKPPDGMHCTDCSFRGHVCWAVAYRDGLALCAYCLDGVACHTTQAAVRRMLAAVDICRRTKQ
jgi:hypothetical protein